MMHVSLPDIAETISFASLAHQGQTDKMGEPYILHPLRVMLAMQTPVERTVAVLHDVVEDTETTLVDLEARFPPIVVDAVDAISKRDGENHDDYLDRVADNPVALRVKMADARDNMSPMRIYNLSPRTSNRLIAKYRKTIDFLQNAELLYERR